MDAGTWPHITWAILGVLMFMGACAGSTTGGFKSIRVLMLLKVLRNEFRHILHPNAVLPVKMSGQSIPQGRLVTLLAFFTIYVIALLLTTIIMVVSGVDITNAATISLSLISNVGAGWHQVALLVPHAGRTSGNHRRAGALYSFVLERELVLAFK